MIIAVISDTHFDSMNPEIDRVFEQHLQATDMLVHCGDMTDLEVHDYFNCHKNFRAVRGNCDWNLELPASLSFELEGMRIGVAHGWGPRSSVGEAVARAFGPGYDLILYGHTHMRDWSTASTGARLLNPGSVFFPRDGQAGLALLELEAGQQPRVQWIDLPRYNV